MTDEPKRRGRPPNPPKERTLADLTISEFEELLRRILKNGRIYDEAELAQYKQVRGVQ